MVTESDPELKALLFAFLERRRRVGLLGARGPWSGFSGVGFVRDGLEPTFVGRGCAPLLPSPSCPCPLYTSAAHIKSTLILYDVPSLVHGFFIALHAVGPRVGLIYLG